MATHIVYGCYNSTTKQVDFDDTETGCTDATITGCLETSGEHEGQIKITHDYNGCETQYYACYDPATGKFEFEADDACCEEVCVYSDDDCACFAAGKTPYYIQVVITGAADYSCAVDLNGTHIMEHGALGLPGDCVWGISGDNWMGIALQDDEFSSPAGAVYVLFVGEEKYGCVFECEDGGDGECDEAGSCDNASFAGGKATWTTLCSAPV